MTQSSSLSNRLLSLDFYRGLVMFLLVAEFSHLFEVLLKAPKVIAWVAPIADFMFHHVRWEGLHFWDLIQPFFMFIVGVSIPLSYANRLKKGDAVSAIQKHAFRRAFLLLLFGWGLYNISPQKIIFQFDNVLAQLSFTYLLAFLISRRGYGLQFAVALGCILLSDLLYRFFSIPGFDNAFVAGENFGAWFNIFLSGYEYPGHWAAFNALPTAAHTIWGVMAGKWLLSSQSNLDKAKWLFYAGLIALVVGYALTPFTPIIKRICTSSFIFISGGWAILALALCFWLIDVKGIVKNVTFFRVVGVNPLFIYLFSSIGGARMLQRVFAPYSNTLLGPVSQWFADLVLGLWVLFLLWYLCHWLYKNRIFIKI